MNIQKVPTVILRRWIRSAKEQVKTLGSQVRCFFRFNDADPVFTLAEIKAELERRCARELELID
jgi:hypothetical protein